MNKVQVATYFKCFRFQMVQFSNTIQIHPEICRNCCQVSEVDLPKCSQAQVINWPKLKTQAKHNQIQKVQKSKMKQVLVVNWFMWCPIRMAKWSMLGQNPTLFVGATLRAGRICNKKPKKLPENENLLGEKKTKRNQTWSQSAMKIPVVSGLPGNTEQLLTWLHLPGGSECRGKCTYGEGEKVRGEVLCALWRESPSLLWQWTPWVAGILLPWQPSPGLVR